MGRVLSGPEAMGMKDRKSYEKAKKAIATPKKDFKQAKKIDPGIRLANRKRR